MLVLSIFMVKQSWTVRMKQSLTLKVKAPWYFEIPGTNTLQQCDLSEDLYRMWLIYFEICNDHRCSQHIRSKLCELCEVYHCPCSTVCCSLFNVHTNWDTVTETVNCVYLIHVIKVNSDVTNRNCITFDGCTLYPEEDSLTKTEMDQGTNLT